MTKTFDAVVRFFEEQEIKLTIVEMEKDKDVLTVSFEAPHVHSMRALATFMRQEQSDCFILMNIKETDGGFVATVVAKKLFENLFKFSHHIGTVFGHMIDTYSPVIMDEDAVEVFGEGIDEMLALAKTAEDLTYQLIAPKTDALLDVVEFKEATSHIFNLYRGMLDKKVHHYYNEMIHIIDRLD